MIIERLLVRGFRRFAQPFEFRPDARFTVIYAPNGTGKSTLLDALYFGLLERHTVTGESARLRFKSLGRDLTPTIEIDFAVGTVRYRLRKSFLANTRSASLQRFEGGVFVALKDGGAADDFIRELLCADAAGRGAIDPHRHLGFAHILWSPARSSFTELPETVNDQIRCMLGGTTLAVTPGERAVQELVAERYAHFFTKERKYRNAADTANLPQLEERLGRARDIEDIARHHHEQLDRMAVDFADRQAEAERMNVVRNSVRADILELRDKVTRFNTLTNTAERLARVELETRARFERISNTLKLVVDLRSERDSLMSSSIDLASKLDSNIAAATIIHARYSIIRQANEDAKAAATRVQQRAAAVSAAQTYVDLCDEAERLRVVCVDHAALTTELVKHAEWLARTNAPTRVELDALMAASAQIDVLQGVITASALTLQIDARSDLSVDVIAGATTGAVMVGAGSTKTFTAADESIVVEIAGFGRIRARGADGAAKARKHLRALLAQIDSARARFNMTSLIDLADRVERSADLQRQIELLRNTLQAVLGDRSLAEIQSALAIGRQRLDAFRCEYPEWKNARPDAVELRTSFDRDLQRAADVCTGTSVDLTALEGPRADVDLLIARLRSDGEVIAAKLETLTIRLQSLVGDGLDDAQRAEHLRTCTLEWSAAKAQLDVITDQLGAFSENPHAELDRLLQVEQSAGSVYEQALGDARQYQAKLEMQSQLGSYANLTAAEERTMQFESELTEARAQASAIACLRDAFERIAAGRIASVIEPITETASHYLTRIAGSPVGKIELTDGLSPAGITTSASALRLAIDGTLSAGEKEQIFLATRLALAEVISRGRGRQLFVVDDAMTATDPNRLRRFLTILEELSRTQLQVIVTTADRSRYLGVSGAQHVDLSAALLGEFAA